MYERGSPIFGAQATSRTQSVWPSSTSSSTHACVSSENPQILTMLSHPALANRFTGGERAPPVLDTASSEPARAAGAHETALHPMAWASNTSAPHWPSSGHFQFSPSWKKKEQFHSGVAPLKVRTEILPSEEAQARMAPSSWGAHDTELTGTTVPRVKEMVQVGGGFGAYQTQCVASAP